MKKFVTSVVLFLLPFALLLSVFELPFYLAACLAGELKPVEEWVRMQEQDPTVLVGMGYNEQTACYKLQTANERQAPVLALGTSRVQQFKITYFTGGFYNCGGAVSGNYGEYKNFLENLTYAPEILIIGLDTWVFNDAWNQGLPDHDEFIPINKTERSMGALMKTIRSDWKSGKWSFAELENYAANLGFNGKIRDSGYMYDGSHYNGYLYRYPELQRDYMFADTLARIQGGHSRFEYGQHIDADTLRQLEELLSYCKAHDIYVIGFQPPFAPSIYDTMAASGNYGYLPEVAPACRTLFSQYGFEFYDYVDGETLGVDDSCFNDGFHGSEVTYGRIVADMAKNGSVLAGYIDLEKVEYLVDHAYSGQTFYDPDARPAQ